MIKTIDIGNGQTFEINSSNGWLYTYQEQFGHDVLPVLLPAAEALIQAFAKVAKNADGNVSDVSGLLSTADDEALTDMFITLSGMQLTTVTNIVWAMAKNAKSDIEEPRTWLNKFDVFPWDIIVPQALTAALEACVSKKKYDTIREILQTASPSALSVSQSQQSTEA